jgi:hypothetical protein
MGRLRKRIRERLNLLDNFQELKKAPKLWKIEERVTILDDGSNHIRSIPRCFYEAIKAVGKCIRF